MTKIDQCWSPENQEYNKVKVIDFSDEVQLKELMAEAKEFNYLMFGKDEDGSTCTIQIHDGNIEHHKLTKDGKYFEVHVYWEDGTFEEYYEPVAG